MYRPAVVSPSRNRRFARKTIDVKRINVPIDLDSPMALKKLFESPNQTPEKLE